MGFVLQKHLWHGQRKIVRGITIDPEGCRERDDAFWIELKQRARRKLFISIADVSPFVSLGSETDREALRCGMSRYGSSKYDSSSAKLMLPKNIAEDVGSLNRVPGIQKSALKPALTVSVLLDENFLPVSDSFKLRPTWLDLVENLTYVEADQILKRRSHELYPILCGSKTAALNLLQMRQKRGSIGYIGDSDEIGRPEPKKNISQRIVQEFMLLTNSFVAEFLLNNSHPAIFRNQRTSIHSPSVHMILEDMAKSFILPSKCDPATMAKRINLLLERAEYNIVLFGHHSLNLPAYTHFTSPLRRYADLVVHRIIHAILEGKEPVYSRAELEKICTHINRLNYPEDD